MKKFSLSLFLTCFFSPLFIHAAAPLMHFILSEKFLDYAVSIDEKQKRSFIVGNIFPDIRYLGEISREETHETGLLLNEIINTSSPFLRGIRLHAFVDEIREALVLKWNIYEYIDAFEENHKATLLKLIEDEILYDQMTAQSFSILFDTILEEEIMAGVSPEAIQKWHHFLKSYLNQKPSKLLSELSQRKLSFFNIPAETIQTWSEIIPQLSSNTDLKNYVHALMDYFLSLFSEFNETQELLPIPIYSPIKTIRSIETDDCLISIIENTDGIKSIVKQIKDKTPSEQFLLVLDAFACSIAKEQKIPINNVTLIPPGIQFPGKNYTEYPASLHCMAPGIATSEKEPWSDFDIHQRFRKEGSYLWEKWGPLPSEDTGLTRTVIHNMSLHSQLALIVALDTFTGNADRSNPNIFYNEKTDSFCGIDMAAAFNTNLAKPAYTQIHCLFKKVPFSLNKSEVEGLVLYRNTIRSLSRKYSISNLYSRLESFSKQAGFFPGSDLFTSDVQDRINHHRNIINQNYQDTLYLLHLLDTYLGK